jgi:hypothetical protein
MKQWTDDPEIHCPACGRTGHLWGSWEYQLGSERECECGAVLECDDVEMTRSWRWKVIRAERISEDTDDV